MLQRSPYTPSAGQRQPRRHFTISGQSVAKASWDPRGRAYRAASWILGDLTIEKPTLRQAADLFGACEAIIRRERQKIETTTAPPPAFRARPIDDLWAGMSADDRDQFVRGHLLGVWDAIERVTA
jgi:hypothetical protein